jgi:hypothetical protein
VSEKSASARTVRKVREGSREWLRREKQFLELYRPRQDNCKTCGSPKHVGYTCWYCGGQ